MKKKIKAIWLPENLATKIKVLASKKKKTIIQFLEETIGYERIIYTRSSK